MKHDVVFTERAGNYGSAVMRRFSLDGLDWPFITSTPTTHRQMHTSFRDNGAQTDSIWACIYRQQWDNQVEHYTE